MIVNGFNIDDPEEAAEYLRSQCIDVDAVVDRGLKKNQEILRHQALSMSGVVGSACSCTTELDRWNCEKDCVNKPKIIQS